MRSVLVKHEQGAAFMAGGYARIAHRPSACIATAGPGATNLITGIANAYAERLPVLAITIATVPPMCCSSRWTSSPDWRRWCLSPASI
ncbi:MAG TPA: thiamine pyrophosphate-binding protein [Gammaproteobacteria bacterium]|nr:thiamine pyrophosphate-binding protein [Gammaproteobacteria bacterium]